MKLLLALLKLKTVISLSVKVVQLRVIIGFRIKELSFTRSFTQSLVWAGPALGAGNVHWARLTA